MPDELDELIDAFCEKEDAFSRMLGSKKASTAKDELNKLRERDALLVTIVNSWSAYQATMDAVGPENKMHWVDFLAAMRAAQQTGEADVCRVCGGDGIQDSGVRGKRKCVACDGTGKP